MNFRFRVTSCVAILSSATLLCLPGTRTFEDGRNRFPPETSEKMNQYWDMYKARYNKTYSENMEAARRIAWEKNLVTIYKHNMMAAAGHHSYTLRDNHIADLGTRQYVRNMVKLIPSRKRRVSNALMVGAVLHDPQLVPPRLDWREAGFQTPPENQQSCGSCYAYSVAGSIEGQIFKRTGMLIPLSVQQLVDCSITTGNLGCAGGSLRNTLRYLEKARGLMDRAEYPYKGRQGPCHFQEAASVVNITSWAVLPARDEQALEAAVATIGPIAASINASPKTFQLYQYSKKLVQLRDNLWCIVPAMPLKRQRTKVIGLGDSRSKKGTEAGSGDSNALSDSPGSASFLSVQNQGVYDDETCSSDKVNHAVLIVGYTPTEWILKNWWGDGWGEDGYMRLAKNKNRCGIANYAAYAKV